MHKSPAVPYNRQYNYDEKPLKPFLFLSGDEKNELQEAMNQHTSTLLDIFFLFKGLLDSFWICPDNLS